MEEILAKLLESDLLSEDTKQEITESFNAAVEAMKDQLKEEAKLSAKADLVEEWTKQRDSLIEAVDEKVTEMVADEFIELKEDIERFRDLEVEYAEKIVTEKRDMAGKLAEELDELVEKLDSFLEYRIEEEMNELKEDIKVVRENEFGREIYEAFVGTFNKFVDDDSVQAQLKAAENELTETKSRLAEMEEEKMIADREKTMNEVLAPLSGVKREQMAMILQGVATEKLQESYNMFVGKILKEEKEPTKEQLKENKKPAAKKTVVKDGNTAEEKKPASKKDDQKSLKEEAELKKLREIAGIK